MLSELNHLSETNRVLGLPIKCASRIGLKSVAVWNEATGLARAKGLGKDKFQSLERYKKIHEGESCFIVATGPSLTIEDLELIKGEYTFSMNSICKLYKKTDFRPTYYGIQDQFVYGAIEQDILMYYMGAQNVFVSDRIARYYRMDRAWNLFPLAVAYSAYDCWFRQKYWSKFSDDIHRLVYSGFSITYSLIEIAVYMGFKNIYLLGADCSFSKDKPNHVAEHGVVDSNIDTIYYRNIAGYQAVASYIKDKPINVYNATRGGSLEIFPRISLESVVDKRH